MVDTNYIDTPTLEVLPCRVQAQGSVYCACLLHHGIVFHTSLTLVRCLLFISKQRTLSCILYVSIECHSPCLVNEGLADCTDNMQVGRLSMLSQCKQAF